MAEQYNMCGRMAVRTLILRMEEGGRRLAER